MKNCDEQHSKIHKSVHTTQSARNLGLFLSITLPSPIKSRHFHIRELRCINPCLDSKTASTIAVSIVHSELDYCNALYFHVLPNFQTNRLQLIQNSLPRSVVKAHKFSHIILVFISSHPLSIRNYLCWIGYIYSYLSAFIVYRLFYLSNTRDRQNPEAHHEVHVVGGWRDLCSVMHRQRGVPCVGIFSQWGNIQLT